MVRKRGVAEMISTGLLVYCLIAGAAYLFLISLVLEFFAKRLKVFDGFPPEVIESGGGFWFTLNFAMELLLYVVIPSITYSYFYIMLPLSGIRTGIAGALFAFTLGAVPAMVALLVRTRLPIVTFCYLLLGILLKLTGVLIIIGYLYQL
jgi:hypothetical protein